MINQLWQLFNRYCGRHLKASVPGFPMFDDAEQPIGHLDRISLVDGRLTLEGWTLANRATLTVDRQRQMVFPNLVRTDVSKLYDWDETQTLGFVVDASYSGHSSGTLGLEFDDVRYVYQVPKLNLRFARSRLMLPFAATVVRMVPALISWKMRRDPSARAKLKNAFGLDDPVTAFLSNPDLFPNENRPVKADPPSLMETPITIVLPVYNAFELLEEVLNRVVQHTDLPWHLIIVEDCSTDERVRPFLQDFVADLNRSEPERVTLIENATNQGFIRSVNAALKMSLSRNDHVVLLNSDAFVPAGWASRLVRPILAHDNVASVTPMSNDAEIFTSPVICQRHDLAVGQADRIDELAKQFNPDSALASAPTGVGFCMAINHKYLNDVPQLDTTFGRGYGEEVDWCQKVRKKGGRHLGLPSLYVEHRGGTSFGSAEKLKLVETNNAIISKRYPYYDAEVQTFIRHDPMSAARLALAIGWAAENQQGPLSIYIAHALGGGAEDYLKKRIASEVEDANSAIVLRVGHAHEWQVELHTQMGVTSSATNDFSFLERLLEPITERHIVYSNGVGHRDPVTLPQRIQSLKQDDRDTIEILFHDFLPISPSYTLLNAKGFFDGVPPAESLDPAHQSRGGDGRKVSLAEWRAAWGALLREAETVTVFSENSQKLVLDAYPDVAEHISLRPHTLFINAEELACETRQADEVVIGVLGNIGYQKGAAVLRDMAAQLAKSKAARLVVIGNVDPTYPLVAPAKIHGDYKIGDIPSLVKRYGITCWLIPSIWPETFSYTTHEALATGLPVWCFDLGAPADIVASHLEESGQGGIVGLTHGKPSVSQTISSLVETKA
ncbi:Glycosyl transferase family 2 [Sulfitobacter noctilucicola]|nr:Glycosyl transferase family 2 [Sulfitobacter noctilucicola]